MLLLTKFQIKINRSELKINISKPLLPTNKKIKNHLCKILHGNLLKTKYNKIRNILMNKYISKNIFQKLKN